ncbi:MAG TPA: hypothetical protein VE476_09540 [Propionibacteriaceae bacterium]|nr:hypothetical protein [Propionibacteriaceae bacterium]
MAGLTGGRRPSARPAGSAAPPGQELDQSVVVGVTIDLFIAEQLLRRRTGSVD